MLDPMINGLLLVLAWPTLGYLLMGVGIGFVVGLIPGLGSIVTLALLLPFTYALEPASAFAMLLSIVAVTGTTSDITATTLGVPGDATAAANVLDGYPLTKKGQGGRALGAVISASTVGALFGALMFALALPVARPVVLALGTPEFFMMIVCGLTFVAALGSGAMLKSLIVALLGLLLSTIGIDPQGGALRFTLGQLALWDGIGLVPLALGLFAVPELLDLGIRKTRISEGPMELSGVIGGIKDMFRHLPLTLRCSAIGVWVGMLPGLGGAVAQWIAYAHAVQTSDRFDAAGKERFGHGAIEGVVSAGAVNNAKDGGGLIPTVTFGIPGTITTALLLAAMMIHGLRPGPDMLTVHLDLTVSLVWILVLSNLVATALAFIFLKPIVRIATIRAGIILPPIIVFVCIGAYATRSQFADIIVMLVAGAVGVVMIQGGWPRAPLVLGLVLGKLAETYLFRSIGLYGMTWLTRPVVLFLALLAGLSVGYSLYSERKSNRQSKHRRGNRP